MATRQGTHRATDNDFEIAEWSDLDGATADVGTPVSFGDVEGLTAQQIAGTPNSITLQGSNDPTFTNWFTLKDPEGVDIAVIAALTTGALIGQRPLFIRPLAGGTTADAVVRIVGKRRKG